MEEFLLGHARARDVVEVELVELLEPLQALVDGGEVGQHAAQPALVDERHPHPAGLLGDGLLRLLFGSDVQDGPAVGNRLLDELVGAIDEIQRLLQVDDVDAIALGEDEALHLRVPPPGLVPEVDAALKELTHGDDRCHPGVPFPVMRRASGHGRARLVLATVRTSLRAEPADR